MSKWFGDVVAVSDVSFALGAGRHRAARTQRRRQVHACSGCSAGLVPPDRGELRILGRDPRATSACSAASGSCRSRRRCSTRRRPSSSCSMAGVLHGIPRPDRAARQALAARRARPRDPRRLSTYSRGMRQRVKVAQAIVHSPAVIVLDEPLTGLDPRQRRHMTDLFHALGDLGCCVIVSSHVLDEVERFGSDVLVIAQGRLAAEGDFRAIRDLMDDRPHRSACAPTGPTSSPATCCADGLIVGLRAGRRADGDRRDDEVHALPPERRRRGPRHRRPAVGGRPARRRPRLGLPLPGGPAVTAVLRARAARPLAPPSRAGTDLAHARRVRRRLPADAAEPGHARTGDRGAGARARAGCCSASRSGCTTRIDPVKDGAEPGQRLRPDRAGAGGGPRVLVVDPRRPRRRPHPRLHLAPAGQPAHRGRRRGRRGRSPSACPP